MLLMYSHGNYSNGNGTNIIVYCEKSTENVYILSSEMRLAMVTVIFSCVSSFPSSLRSLAPVSNSFYLLHSPPTLSRSLLTQSSHHNLGLPRLLFPSIFLASAPFANIPTPIFSTCLAHFSLLHTTFFLNLPSLQPPLSVRPVFSYLLSSLPRFF